MFAPHGSRSNSGSRPQSGLSYQYELCGRVYVYDYRKGHTKRECNSCRSNGRVNRTALKRQLVEYKGGCCELCGYDRCLQRTVISVMSSSRKWTERCVSSL